MEFVHSGVTMWGWGGRTAPGDTLQGGDTRMKSKILWLNLERTVDKRGRTAKNVITLQTAMTKKGIV